MSEALDRILTGREILERPAYRFPLVPRLFCVEVDAWTMHGIIEPVIDGRSPRGMLAYIRQGVRFRRCR